MKYKSQVATLPLLIVAGNGPALFGRDWLGTIKLDWEEIHCIQKDSVNSLLEKYNPLFTDDLGLLKDFQANIHVDPQVPPKFCKPRPIPYAYKALVEDELDRLLALGIISPVQFSEWAAPIVPVLKSDKKSVRICGDYSVTVNKASKLECYPIPKLDDLLTSLSGGAIFTKLDMSQAYQQIELSETSKQYVVVNTHKGLFKYNRLPFGVSSAPAIFQRVMESLLQGIPNVVVYIDDILIAGKTYHEHTVTLEKVLTRLQEAGLRLKKDKCYFTTSSVTYLGYSIDKDGIHPTTEKVRAIKDAPTPKNVTQLKAYLGLLSYYNRFLPHLPTVLAPLYKLLHKGVAWTAEMNTAFTQSKELLSSDDVLVHFEPNKELLLACDASQYGIGAVLAHKFPDGSERPIAFASRTLNDAEKKYSQIEKEGLACVYGVKKFHQYVYGRSFNLITDHKPLLSLLSGDRQISSQSSARIQRWALTLAGYEYKLSYKRSNDHANADGLSRLPLADIPTAISVPPELILLMETISDSPITAKQISLWTKADAILSKVLYFINHGWPDTCPNESMKPYWSRQSELSVLDGCILWASRVIVPIKGRQQLLFELHEGHFGISKAKSRARSCIWWPGIDKDIEQTVKDCRKCQENRNAPTETLLHPWPWPSRPWSRLHIDFAGPIYNTMFLVIIDAHSKWIEVFPMSNITATSTVQRLKILFAQFGIPDTIVSDNGPTFVSAEFESYLQQQGIHHFTSAPYHPASNGLAERAVQIIKNGLKRDTTGTITDRLARILFNYRISSQNTTGVSPSELMFNRQLKSKLDLVKPDIGAPVNQKQFQQRNNTTFMRRIVHSRWGRKYIIEISSVKKNGKEDVL